MNVIYQITKLQRWGYDRKLEILIQKIKVRKWDLNLYFLKNTLIINRDVTVSANETQTTVV